MVERRAKSQKSLLDIYRFLEKHEKALGSPSRTAQWPIFALLIGASFSLWRAVFLSFNVERPKKDRQAIQHAKKFLELLVRDNAIGYPQDRESKEWTSGYYLNGARYRLERVFQKLEQTGITLADADVEKFRKLDSEGISSNNLMEVWDTCQAATTAAFNEFQRAWGKPSKPAK